MMPEDERPDDEKIGAWLDGELDSDGATGMTFSSATNAAFLARADRLRQIDSLVRAAVPDEEPLSEELLERLGLSDPKPDSRVISMANFRRLRGAGNDNGVQRRSGSKPVWQIAAQVALVVAVGLGGFMLVRSPGEQGVQGGYRTLSDQVAPADLGAVPTNALVIFVDGTDAKTARKIIQAAGGQLIGTPNDAGAWKVALAPTRRDAALATLRKDARIALAEPLDGGVR